MSKKSTFKNYELKKAIESEVRKKNNDYIQSNKELIKKIKNNEHNLHSELLNLSSSKNTTQLNKTFKDYKNNVSILNDEFERTRKNIKKMKGTIKKKLKHLGGKNKKNRRNNSRNKSMRNGRSNSSKKKSRKSR